MWHASNTINFACHETAACHVMSRQHQTMHRIRWTKRRNASNVMEIEWDELETRDVHGKGRHGKHGNGGLTVIIWMGGNGNKNHEKEWKGAELRSYATSSGNSPPRSISWNNRIPLSAIQFFMFTSSTVIIFRRNIETKQLISLMQRQVQNFPFWLFGPSSYLPSIAEVNNWLWHRSEGCRVLIEATADCYVRVCYSKTCNV